MTTAEAVLRILHLSDSHLFGDDTLHYGRVDTAAALRRVLDRAAELQDVDVVVASGDLSDDGSAASYTVLRELLEPWARQRGAAVVYAMGNHDERAGFEQVLGSRARAADIRGYRLVTVDTSVPGYGYGVLNEEELAALRAMLAEPAEHGTILVCHHPPVAASTALLAALELQDPHRLVEVCAGGDVRLILSGHYHHALASEAGGIPVIVAPGIANTTDVLAPRGRERATAGSGFGYVEVPSAGPVRAMFCAAPGTEDGLELFHLGEDEVARIGAEYGLPAGEAKAR